MSDADDVDEADEVAESKKQPDSVAGPLNLSNC